MKTKFLLAALAAALLFALPAPSASAYVGVSVTFAPPAIPIYAQPYCPAPGYFWVPGYWGYGPYGYYWIPGSWVRPPRIGLLWTPGYWGYSGGRYLFNDGYWGPRVGFYGGINYGYGYGGYGYYGGRWVGSTFHYNTAVTRVNTAVIRNTYVNREVINNRGSRAGFNGPGGAQARPTAQQRVLAKSERVAPTSAQRSRVEAARKDPALRAKNNRGKPKADVVQSFHNKNRSDRGNTAAADRESRAERAPRALPAADNNRAQAAKTRNAQQRSSADQKAAAKRAAAREERAAQADRTRERAARATEAKRAERNVERRPEVKRSRQVRQAPAPARSVRQAPSVQRRPQAASSRQAAPQRRSGPAQAPQKAKKKKKRENKPDDQ
ncbi:hypothetical protein BH20VER3_BH20VER3_15860 [soil metagenome]